MNKERRKLIQNIIDRLGEIREDIDTVTEEERDYCDSIPENLQGSERYDRAEEAVTNLEDAMDNVDEAIGMLESAME